MFLCYVGMGMRSFEIAHSHEGIAVVLALAGGQASSAVFGWGREGFQEGCFRGVRRRMQVTGRGCLVGCVCGVQI